MRDIRKELQMIQNIEKRTDELLKQDKNIDSIYRKIILLVLRCNDQISNIMPTFPSCIKQRGRGHVTLSREEGLQKLFKLFQERLELDTKRTKNRRKIRKTSLLSRSAVGSMFEIAVRSKIKDKYLRCYSSRTSRSDKNPDLHELVPEKVPNHTLNTLVGRRLYAVRLKSLIPLIKGMKQSPEYCRNHKVWCDTSAIQLPPLSELPPNVIRCNEPLRQTYVLSKAQTYESYPQNKESVIEDVEKDDQSNFSYRKSPQKSIQQNKITPRFSLPKISSTGSLTTLAGESNGIDVHSVSAISFSENDSKALKSRHSFPLKNTKLPPLAMVACKNRHANAERMKKTLLEKSYGGVFSTDNRYPETKPRKQLHNVQLTFDSVINETKRPLNLPPIIGKSKSRHRNSGMSK